MGVVGRAERAGDDERCRDQHGDASGPPEHLLDAGQPTVEPGGQRGHAMIPFASSTTPTPIAVRVSHFGPVGVAGDQHAAAGDQSERAAGDREVDHVGREVVQERRDVSEAVAAAGAAGGGLERAQRRARRGRDQGEAARLGQVGEVCPHRWLLPSLTSSSAPATARLVGACCGARRAERARPSGARGLGRVLLWRGRRAGRAAACSAGAWRSRPAVASGRARRAACAPLAAGVLPPAIAPPASIEAITSKTAAAASATLTRGRSWSLVIAGPRRSWRPGA